MKIYSAPKADRGKIAKKMLLHCLFAFVFISISVTMLFVNISKDSVVNQNAIKKVSSEATETWAVITFLVFIAAIIYLSLAGIVLSSKIRRQFSNFVYYKGQLFLVTASVPYASAKARPRQVSRALKLQDQALDILKDTYTLARIIENENECGKIRAIKLSGINKIAEKKYGAQICFDNIKIKVSKDTNNFEELMDIFKGLVVY